MEMIFMKRRTLILCLLTLTILSLSGCTKDKLEEPTSPTLEVIEPETSETISDKLDDNTASDFVIGTVEAIVVGEDGQALSESEAAILESESEKEAESRAEEIRAAQETAETSETLDSSLSEALEKHDKAMKEKMADGETLSNEELAKVTSDVDAYYTEKARAEYLESVKKKLDQAKEKGIEKYVGITEEELESYSLEQLMGLNSDLFYDLQ